MSEIDVRDNGAHVIAARGDHIVIHLDEEVGTGYEWSLNEIGDVVEIEANELHLEEGHTHEGERVLVLRAVRPGTSRASLSLLRSWDHPLGELDRFDITIEIE